MSFLDWLISLFSETPAQAAVPPAKIEIRKEAPKMNKFDRAMKFVLRWEGGYSNHENDPGGETSFGIAKRSHPDVDIANLTEEGAKKIYREDYWNKIHGDDLPPAIALAVMDYAVNSGTRRAARTLQQVIGAGIDGDIGPKTLKKMNAAVDKRGGKKIAQDIVMERAIFLSSLVKNKPTMLVFLTGWMKRTHQCMAKVSE